MTLEERIQDFKTMCSCLFGEDPLFCEFTDYWTEHSPGAKKARWEKEKVFDIKKRFATWKRNSEKWDKTSKKPTFVDKVMDKQTSLNDLYETLKNEYK